MAADQVVDVQMLRGTLGKKVVTRETDAPQGPPPYLASDFRYLISAAMLKPSATMNRRLTRPMPNIVATRIFISIMSFIPSWRHVRT